MPETTLVPATDTVTPEKKAIEPQGAPEATLKNVVKIRERFFPGTVAGFVSNRILVDIGEKGALDVINPTTPEGKSLYGHLQTGNRVGVKITNIGNDLRVSIFDALPGLVPYEIVKEVEV